MEYKKINELTTVVTGGTPSTRKNEYWDNGDIPWLQSGCCQNCDVDSTEKYITKEGYNNSSTHMMSADTVMIALTGATAGKVGYLKFEACGNQSITGILPCESLNQRYLFFYLLSQREKILADCVGGAQAHISQSYVKNMTIPILAIKEQEQIVGELTKVSNIVSLRQEEIQQLDNLVKARFVEMFGDPIQNPKGWDMPLIEEVVANEKNALKAGPFGSALKKEYYVASGYKIYGQEQVISGDCTFGDYYIDEERYKSLENCAVQPGDVLISLVGTYGKLLIMPEVFEPGIINPRLMKITFDKEKVNPYYFKFFFQSESLKKALSQNTHGGTMDILNLGIVRKIEMPLPPLKLQNEFVDFVHQVNKSKFDTMTFAPIYAIINLYLHTYFYQGRR